MPSNIKKLQPKNKHTKNIRVDFIRNNNVKTKRLESIISYYNFIAINLTKSHL